MNIDVNNGTKFSLYNSLPINHCSQPRYPTFDDYKNWISMLMTADPWQMILGGRSDAVELTSNFE